jgi:hypothetical protein
MWRIALAVTFALTSIACGRGDVAEATTALALPTPQPDEVLLDLRADGAALFGRVRTPLPNADPERVVLLRSELGGAPIAGGLEGAAVLDARFSDEGLVVLGLDHVLRVHPPRGAPLELDAQAYGPLSVEGAFVAYVRGEMPDLEVARADARTGAVEPITQSMAPTWSPALSPDGREVVFVSGVEGAPRLYRSGGGAPRELPRTERFPTAPSAPRWRGETLFFEDERGVGAIDLAQGRLLHDAPGAHGLVALPDGTLAASTEAGRLEALGGAR